MKPIAGNAFIWVSLITKLGGSFTPEQISLGNHIVPIELIHILSIECHPQTNGICERFHKTNLNEFYQVTSSKKIYDSLEMLQKDIYE
jgi:hypothetical protein